MKWERFGKLYIFFIALALADSILWCIINLGWVVFFCGGGWGDWIDRLVHSAARAGYGFGFYVTYIGMKKIIQVSSFEIFHSKGPPISFTCKQ